MIPFLLNEITFKMRHLISTSEWRNQILSVNKIKIKKAGKKKMIGI